MGKLVSSSMSRNYSNFYKEHSSKNSEEQNSE